MDKDSLAITIVGLGITLGFLGFLAYMMTMSRQEQAPEQQTQPIQVYIPKEHQPIKTEENPPKKPTIINHILNEANTWYEIPIPKDIRTWSMNARGEYDLYYAFEPSHANYRTLFSGMFLDSDTAPNNINTIYVSSSTAGAVVEITIFR